MGRILYAGAIPDGAGLGGPRTRDVYAFVYLVSGSGRYRDASGLDVRLRAGSTITVFPGMEHDYGPGPGEAWTERYLFFDGPLLRLLEERGIISRSRPVGSLRPVTTWLPEVEGVTAPTPGGARSAVVELARLQEILAAVHAGQEAGGVASSWFRRACLLLEHEPGLNLDGVAAAVGMSYHRFRKQFTAVAGEAPGKWRTR